MNYTLFLNHAIKKNQYSINRAAVCSGPRRRGFYLFVDVVAVHFEISRLSGVTDAVVNMSVPSSLMKQPPIQSTAGAVPVRNEKGTVLSGFPVGSYLFRQHIPNLPRAQHLIPSDP